MVSPPPHHLHLALPPDLIVDPPSLPLVLPPLQLLPPLDPQLTNSGSSPWFVSQCQPSMQQWYQYCPMRWLPHQEVSEVVSPAIEDSSRRRPVDCRVGTPINCAFCCVFCQIHSSCAQTQRNYMFGWALERQAFGDKVLATIACPPSIWSL